MFFSKLFAIAAVAVVAAVSVGAAPLPLPMQVARRGEQRVEALEVLPMKYVHKRADVNLVPVEQPSMAPNGEIEPFVNPGAKRSEEAPPSRRRSPVNVEDAAMSVGGKIIPYTNPNGKRSEEVPAVAEPMVVERRINTFPSHIASRTDEFGNIVAFES